MKAATVTTTKAVSQFLKNCNTPPPAPKPWAAEPPNHRCPYCTSVLTAEEIQTGECWACLSSLTQGITFENPDLNPN